MARNILGIDLGTNSLGLSVRDLDSGENLKEQIVFFESVIFESGVGNGKSGEFSYAAERTSHRTSRRLYQARKYRIWSTLQLLIQEGFCPLTMDELDRWRCYDKARGLKRQYPVDAVAFEQWVRLDFDGDGKADYSSPYQLRAELMEQQLDFDNQTNRYKLGRALYHIAQRRGFKSSKGETKDIQEQKADGLLDSLEEGSRWTDELKEVEKKKSLAIVAYMEEHGLPTVGCAMAHLERHGVRVRNSEYTAVRSQYKDEIAAIFNFQQQLDTGSTLFRRLMSERKGEGTIFYKRPLRSQKGNVGKCTLEQGKTRCAVSHPDFEDFRAWSFINNIKVRNTPSDKWQAIPLELKQRMYEERFLLTRSYFKFEDLRKWLEKELQHTLSYDRNCRTINYADRTSVSGCPVSSRLRNILGDDWRQAVIATGKERASQRTGEIHRVQYNYEDLWHIAFSYQEPEMVEQFAREEAGFDDAKVKEMMQLVNAISQGYSMLSLKAIRLINRFLRKGLIYTDAVLLAKLPEILGEDLWQQQEDTLMSHLEQINATNRREKRLLNIVNNLISQYKVRTLDNQSAFKNHEYTLQPSDYSDIDRCIKESFSDNEWAELGTQGQQQVLQYVTQRYQQFFASRERDYFPLPKLGDAIKDFLISSLGQDSGLPWHKLYQPSQLEFYAPAQSKVYEVDGRFLSLRLLDSPSLGSIKNPMALRTMHVLRRKINDLLKQGLIDEDTKIVVETAREMNDANMRWATKTYQEKQEDANKEIEKILAEFLGHQPTADEVRKTRLLVEQIKLDTSNGKAKEKSKNSYYENEQKEVIKKYRLWLEQGCRCLYTGKVINLSNLFDDNFADIEHTVPRSLSFDDSLANLTICDAQFNRTVKQKRIPSQLDNHEEILQRIQPWMDKVEHLKEQVDLWRAQSRRAADKERKDQCIRQVHLWSKELDYWQRKVKTFTMTIDEFTPGFRNSQLVDTRIVTKYAFHFLKSAFNNVEVQKGEVTAAFRKIMGLQSMDEKKDRSRHSHHAIDAAMLTIIPKAAKRDEMLRLFYEIQEANFAPSELEAKKQRLERMKKECRVGNVDGLYEWIDNTILIDHLAKDQTLTPARRKIRFKGDVSNGPKEVIQHSDCIRGCLHDASWLGAITQHKSEGISYVKRRFLTPKKGKEGEFESWEDIEKHIVNKSLVPMMKSQFPEGTSFANACNQGIYMLNKKGEKINLIRHVRCYVDIKNPAKIKKQTYNSNKEYKRYYYAKNGEISAYAIYWDGTIGTTHTYDSLSLYDLANIMKSEHIDTKEQTFSPNKLVKGEQIPLFAILVPGCTRVMVFRNDEFKKGAIVGEIQNFAKTLKNNEISKRLYVVRQVFSTDGRVKLMHHLEARSDKELLEHYGKAGVNGYSKIDVDQPHPKLLLSNSNLIVLVEGKHFVFDGLGNIRFL